MSANNVYQVLGWLACAGAVLLFALVAVVVLLITGQPGGRYPRRWGTGTIGPQNSAVHQPPFDDEDFGGVPTTGPVQEYERDYHPDQIIGSSGFDGQNHTGRGG